VKKIKSRGKGTPTKLMMSMDEDSDEDEDSEDMFGVDQWGEKLGGDEDEDEEMMEEDEEFGSDEDEDEDENEEEEEEGESGSRNTIERFKDDLFAEDEDDTQKDGKHPISRPPSSLIPHPSSLIPLTPSLSTHRPFNPRKTPSRTGHPNQRARISKCRSQRMDANGRSDLSFTSFEFPVRTGY